MAQAQTNGIQIEYETFGAPAGRPLVLLIGFGCQLVHWSEEVCRQFVDGGHFVIRLDNRDAGLSTKLDGVKVPGPAEIVRLARAGEPVPAPYSYYDMGDDVVGLLDALGIGRAHICGMSQGAAIAQTIAIRHPGRTASLTSIYGTTGDSRLPMAKPEVFKVLTQRPPAEREAAIAYLTDTFRIISGPGFPFEEEWVRRVTARAYDRCFYPQGAGRHFAASFKTGDRTAALGSVTAPALVIHGEEDPLLPVQCGIATARAIPGAELTIIAGMGHDLPYRGAWPRIVAAVTAHTAKAAAAA